TAAPGAPAAPAGAPAVPAATDGPGQPTTAMPAANGAAAPSPPATTPPVRPGQPLRVPGSTTPPPGRLPEPDDEGGSRLAVFGAIGAIVVVAIVAVVLLTGALGGDDPKTQTPNTIGTPSADSSAGESPTKTTTGSSSTTPAAAPAPGTYTVAVLNGTTVPGLARGVANRLQNTKFKIGNVTNAATQDRSATLVEFAPGHRAEADAVAKAIEVGRDAIQPLSPGSKTIAGDQATVVVTVGSDQNTSPQAQTTP
ncbi:MAG: LytR C-terminal domain-containing protein, partial [Baekduia sp.]